MSQVSNKIKNIFLTTTTKVNITNKVNIILSPEFYWVRIFAIPVKSVSQAKHVLPTLFEDILENIDELSYQVIKLEENKYLCFAYINKNIYSSIKNSGVSLSFVNSVYFSQNECSPFNQFTIENKGFLYTDDGILIKVPNNILSKEAIDLNKKVDLLQMTSHKVEIKLYDNLITSKQVYTISIIILILLFINIFKVVDYKNEISLLDSKIEKIKTNANLPSSMIQTNSIIKKNKSKILKEIKKREFLAYILKNSKINLKSLELEKNIINLRFENTNKSTVENYISRKYKIISNRVKGLGLEMKVKL